MLFVPRPLMKRPEPLIKTRHPLMNMRLRMFIRDEGMNFIRHRLLCNELVA